MKRIVLPLLLAFYYFSSAQNVLVHIPINKTDKINNVANSGFSPTFQYGSEQYGKDRFGTDSSAFVLGLRRYFRISIPQTLVEQKFSELRFSLAYKLDTKCL